MSQKRASSSSRSSKVGRRVAPSPTKAVSTPAKAHSSPKKRPSAPAREPASALESWREAAGRLPDGPLRTRLPIPMLLDEAVDLARFFRGYFATVRGADGAVLRPGLDSVAGPGRKLSASSGDELLSLRDAVQEAQSRYLLGITPRDRTRERRARVILRELRAALGYLVRSGMVEAREVPLEAAAKITAGSRSVSALAMDLSTHAEIAEKHRTALDGLGGFDVRLIDEARALFEQLLGLAPPSAAASPVPVTTDPRQPLALRNRLITLLSERMATIRGAARFVFRGSPAIVREATSLHERRRRSASRHAAKEAPGAARERLPDVARKSPNDPSEKTDAASTAAAAPAQPANAASPVAAPKRR